MKRECWNYKCTNKVVNGNSILCPEHLREWAAARDYKYRSYVDERIDAIHENQRLQNNGLIYNPTPMNENV